LYVSRADNHVADALSLFNNKLVMKLVPGLKIFSFQPPHGTLGASQK